MDLLQFLLDKNNIFIFAVAIICALMLAYPALRKGRAGVGLSTSAAIQLVNQRQAIWVDIRSPEHFKAGHIPQARNLPATDLEQKAHTLPKNKPLVLVCENGRDSTRYAAKLRTQGYPEAASLEGGMQAWATSSLPTTQKS